MYLNDPTGLTAGGLGNIVMNNHMRILGANIGAEVVCNYWVAPVVPEKFSLADLLLQRFVTFSQRIF